MTDEVSVQDLKEYSIHIDWCGSRGKYMDADCDCPCPCEYGEAEDCNFEYPGHLIDAPWVEDE